MELNQIKKMAAGVLGIGVNSVRIRDPEEAMQAMTKDDIRRLIVKKVIEKKKTKGKSKAKTRKRVAQKKKSRRKGTGSRKGGAKARAGKKELWMKKVRALRKELIKIKPRLEPGIYRGLYNMTKGGYFRSKAHLKTYIKERGLIKKVVKKEMKTKTTKAKIVKK